jgi:hypothetical protein
MKDNLYVLNSRRNMLASSVYSLSLQEINRVDKENKENSGIQEMVKYSVIRDNLVKVTVSNCCRKEKLG